MCLLYKSILMFLSILCVTLIESSRILICVPCPSVSHQFLFYPLVTKLVNRGHEVVFITTDPMYPKGKAPANLTEIDTHDVSYEAWKEQVLWSGKMAQGNKEVQYRLFSIIIPLVARSFELQMQTQEVQDLIKKKTNFDLLIIEANCKSAQALSHVFKAPMILMSSLGAMQDNYRVIGAPIYPKLLYPIFWHQKLNNLTIFDKIRVLWDTYKIEKFLDAFQVQEDNNVKRLFGPDTPSLEELGGNVQMLFLNVYPIWEYNRPVPPGVVFIGGMHQILRKDLPEDLKAYLDSSEKGVVYFSLGTNVSPSTLSPEKIQAITYGLARLKYDVLIKWDRADLPGKGNNTKVATWLPQSDVLRRSVLAVWSCSIFAYCKRNDKTNKHTFAFIDRAKRRSQSLLGQIGIWHPKIQVFITQGGLQSFDEALAAGVPLIGIPMLGDQWFNVERFISLKIGMGITEDLTEDLLVDAVNTVIDDPSYRRNIVELRGRLHDQPQCALDRAVWWAEHVIRHKGASHLRAPAANISWADYLDVELIAVLVLAALTLLIVAVITLYFLMQFVVRSINGALKLKVA